MSRRKPYTFTKFIIDVVLTTLTGGLWLIWCLFRWAGNR